MSAGAMPLWQWIALAGAAVLVLLFVVALLNYPRDNSF